MNKLIYLLYLGHLVSIPMQAQVKNSVSHYLSVDKPYYAAGEYLICSILQVEETTKKLNLDTAIVHIDLVHPLGAKIQSQAIKIILGRGFGVFQLPDSLSAGIYNLISYQPNDSDNKPRVTFLREIMVDGASVLNIPGDSKVSVSIYPNGGSIIEEIKNMVAICISDGTGAGISLTGSIKDQTGNIAARFSTGPNGCGSFTFIPKANTKYFYELPILSEATVSLTPSAKSGVSLEIDNISDDTLRVTVYNTQELNNSALNFRIRRSDEDILNTTFRPVKGIFRMKIPIHTLLPGIATIEIYEQNRVLASQPVFIRSKKTIFSTIKLSKDTFNTREPVNLSFQALTTSEEPVNADFTVSIFNKQFSSIEPITIFEHKLVESLLNLGKITSLSTNSNLKEINLELPKILDTGHLVYSPQIQEGHLNIIQGKVSNKKTKHPITDSVIVLSLISPASEYPILIFEKTNDKGEFLCALPPINTNYTLFLKLKDSDDTDKTVDFNILNKPTYPTNKKETLTKKKFDLGNTHGYYRIFSENRILQNAFGISYLNIIRNKENCFDEYSFKTFDALYNLNEYVPQASLREVIINIINGVIIKRRKKGSSIHIMPKDDYSNRFNTAFINEPLMLIDGVPVFNAETLLNIPGNDIEKIEVTHRHLFFNDTEIYGLISVITKSKSSEYHSNMNLYQQTSVGIHTETRLDFLQSHPDIISHKLPDFRNLLFYDPLGKVRKETEYTGLFFTSYQTGEFRIQIEGITEGGVPFVATRDFIVK